MIEGQTPMNKWLATAPFFLRAMFPRLTWHTKVRWDAPDYIDDDEFEEGTDGRVIAETLEETEALSSLKKGYADETAPENRFHALLVDIDVKAWMVDSSSRNHSHLYADLHIPEPDLWEFLDAAVKIGLVEEGYVSACKSRGMTSLRAPWIEKGKEPSLLARYAELEAEDRAKFIADNPSKGVF